jgi:L-fuculose-phosphate aldolase
MAISERALRESVVAAAARISDVGFGGASDGDISVRLADSILITPNGAPYRSLRPPLLALMPLAGEYGAWKGPTKPASEWRIHLDIARARPDINAVVRFQSPHASALAMAHKAIPAVHPMIALFGAAEIKCTKYAPMGSKDLAELALEALGAGHAALLGNYGAMTTGGTLDAALARAVELETLAKLYAIALSVGRPRVLSDEEAFRIGERLKTSGADIEARVEALAAESASPAKAKPKIKGATRAPAKGKRIARKRGKT